MRAPDRECTRCGSASVAWEEVLVDVPFMSRAKVKMTARARVPKGCCRSCGHGFLPWEALLLQHAAVCRQLGVLAPEEIVAARKRRRLTQEQLAAETGFGIASIRRWETGANIQNSSSDRLLRMVLGVGPADSAGVSGGE